jgi:D-alanine-D-alanine ligase
MLPEVTIIYNEPSTSRYGAMHESKAVIGVLAEVAAVHSALVNLGYPVSLLPLPPPLGYTRGKLKELHTGIVFNLFEGFEGSPDTESAVADMLAEYKLTSTGCPGSALSLTLDKGKCKLLLEAAGIRTPRCQLLTSESLSAFQLNYPCIVKPCSEDASHGISEKSVVYDLASLMKQVCRVSKYYGGNALVEEYVEGREFNITVMGNKRPVTLPISEIAYSLPVGKPRILTYSAKWRPHSLYFEHTKVVCPALTDPAIKKRVIDTAVSVFKLMAGSGYARVDMRLDTAGHPQVLEVNLNPDIAPDSGAARQARAAGMNYNQFIAAIMHIALGRKAG